jgi:transposase
LLAWLEHGRTIPLLMIRMLIIGYVFAIPSERALCAAMCK